MPEELNIKMSNCVHGHQGSKGCLCDEYWQGNDCSVRTCLEGVLNSTTLECHCPPGSGGEFCHVDICRHDDQWYCDIESPYDRRLCPEEALRAWLPMAIDQDTWDCPCGFGKRVLVGTKSSCVCQEGYYGKFCHLKSCEEGTVWDSFNRTCIDENAEIQISFSDENDDTGKFIDLSSELLLASLLMAIFLIALLVLIRVCVRKCTCNGQPSSDDYLERIAIDEFRARRAGRMPFSKHGDPESGKVPRSGFHDLRKQYDGENGCPNGRAFNRAGGLPHDQPLVSMGAGLLSVHRLTTVIEEDTSEEDETAT